MTELDYIIQNFDRNFRVWRGRRIALSAGEYLEPIVRNFDREYRFCSTLGTDSTEVPDGIDLVILTARRTGKEPDYNRLKASCLEKQVKLLDLFALDQIALHQELAEHRHLTLEQWQDIFSGYDVVSLFIPNVVANFNGFKGRWALRSRFIALFDWLTDQGKPIVVFWESEEQLEPLIEAGIDRSVRLLRRAGNDLGFLQLTELYAGKRVIHVGVGTVRDGIVPREYGLDSRVNRYTATVPSAAGGSVGFCEDRQRVIEAIEGHDVVSFDIFDTLIKRTLLNPSDVFMMVEEQTGIRGFAEHRYWIQIDCPLLSLEEIYKCLGATCGYDAETLVMLREKELEIESDVIRPRSSMVEIYNCTRRLGKTVVLVSDMYLDGGFLRRLLKRCGISGYDALYLSCEYGKLKQDGLFEVLREYRESGKTVLHIGDDPYADAVSAEKYGLEALPVASCLEMARRNGYAEAIGRCRTLGERKLLGLSIAEAFDDPFVLDNDTQIAGMIVAPLAMSYLQWVRGEMAGRKYDRFLFFSRDGWMLLDAYRKLQKRCPDLLPPGLYFYANRHAAFMTVMDDYQLAKHFYFHQPEYQEDPPKLLQKAFHIPADRLLPYRGETLEEYYEKNAAGIRDAAELCCENYRKYMEREGISGGKYAVMDFISQGNTQNMLERNLTEKMDGYYIGIPEYITAGPANIRYFLDSDTMSYDTEMKLEVYFTSPEPALDYVGEDGEPVFAEEVRDEKTLERICRIQKLVRAYLDRYLEKLYDPADAFDRDLILCLCGAIQRYGVENYYYDDMSGQEIRTKP